MAHDKTEKITVMVLGVDLKCSSCYKKAKKVICKFPQIRDQIYIEEENKIKITVVCCSPEKIRDKLCYKGGGVIKTIEILDPPKPKSAEKPKDAPKPAEKPKDAPKPAEKPKDSEKPKEADKPKEKPKEQEKPKEKPKDQEKPKEKPKDQEKPKEKPKDQEKPKEKPKGPEKPKDMPEMPKQGVPLPGSFPIPMKHPEPMMNMPGPGQVPVMNMPPPGQVSVMPFSHGYPPSMYCFEPGYEWYGGPQMAPLVPPPLPQPCYDNYSGWCRCGQPSGYNGCRCDHTYFSEENTNGCTIM
ncbi:unnamed protein product [Cuscuta campestris]|uniref:HMA domain-containing protein n=1 Tax=Cuscuta campestris TaxID=132261 RepID=A0A484M7I6_9ASTE|nr:unnamed protein product [Cuscuta campestris]